MRGGFRQFVFEKKCFSETPQCIRYFGHGDDNGQTTGEADFCNNYQCQETLHVPRRPCFLSRVLNTIELV